LNSPYTIKDYIARVNRSRREHPALQSNNSIRFHPIDNEEIICYTKQTEDLRDVMLMVVNLNPYHTQSGWIHLPLESLGIKPNQPYQLHDLLNNTQYTWEGEYNYVELNPPYHSSPSFLDSTVALSIKLIKINKTG
jgi:starch synthase (maltosyl-transferring)